MRDYYSWIIKEIIRKYEPIIIENEKMKKIFSSYRRYFIIFPIIRLGALCLILKSIVDCILVKNLYWYITIQISVYFIALFNLEIGFLNVARLYCRIKKNEQF